ncbi:MAG: S8 family serine peptidase [Chloroflexi bacterium]|nr:S8 family serine peptidase [Chloroflexota bacterium]
MTTLLWRRRLDLLRSAGRVALLAASLALCFVVSADRTEAQQDDRHGETFATATPVTLGSTIQGYLHDSDDWDVFKLDLSGESGTTDIWVYTTGSDEDGDTVGGLYDSEANLIAFNDDGFIRGGRNYFSLRRTVPPGVYFIVVVSYEGEPTRYTLHVEGVADPGSDTGTQASLRIQSPAGGTIDATDDTDYFKLDVTSRAHLIVEAISVNLTPLTAELLDAEGNEISENIYRLFITGPGVRAWSGFRIRDDFSPGTYYIRVTAPDGIALRPEPYSILAVEDTDYADFISECEASTRSSGQPEIRDSLYGCQWHLSSSNERDINVERVWAEGNKGEGIHIAVVDDGMDHAHEDLRDGVDLELSHDYTGSDDIHDPFEHHGTHVSGIIAARDNAVGVRGVAPRATIYGFNLLAGAGTLANRVDAMVRLGDVTAVSNNSWGPRDGPWLSPTSSFWERAIDAGITAGYDGKGIFYSFAAGNGHLLGDNSNLDEFTNYYGVTAVCSVDSRDGRAGYSEMGANLWVCAPANDRPESLGGAFGILTTENSDRYERDFLGTSAAAPIVSGVAALARSANTDLTWRDLKLILAGSARKNDPGSSGWEDGALKYGSDSTTDRYHFNHEYGFGVVDAGAAVDLAKGWTNLPPLEIATAESDELGIKIPDAPDDGAPEAVTTTLTLDTDIGFVEFVEISASFQHDSFRDLEIELESPSGVVSTLTVPFDTYGDSIPFLDFVQVYGTFRFGSAKHLGEDAHGEWKLRLTDHINAGDGTLDAWTITVYGHERPPGPPTVDSVTTVPGALTAAWTAPSYPSGPEVTAYDLRHVQSDANGAMDPNWTVLQDVWTATAGGDLEYTVTGLAEGARYDVQVRAINAAGDGAWSGTESATVPVNEPPVFPEGPTTTRSVEENSAEGTNVGLPVVATDEEAATYALGGEEAASFEIDSGTGQITVGAGAALDYEEKTSHTVEVTATDPLGALATATVVIMVTDVDLGTPYDANSDEMIDRDEVLSAIADYLFGPIDKDEVLRVIALYLFG